MTHINYQQTSFVTSAAQLPQLPDTSGREIALAGRSNAGKSSALNTLTNQSRLARTSKTPGRTQLINFFQVQDNYYLVDLPGYGYAKAPEAIKYQWQQTVSGYLKTRDNLCGLLLMSDIRHPLKPIDWQLIEWACYTQIPIHVLLTKTDKLKRGAAKNTLLSVRRELSDYHELTSVQLFSAHARQGIEEAQEKCTQWFTNQGLPGR